MTLSTVRQPQFFRPAMGSLLAVVAGLVLWAMPVGDGWINASYDYLFHFSTASVTNRVVIILIDNESYAALVQNREEAWDRSLHTRLFNKLADDGCALVVPDVLFRRPGVAAVDQAMAGALHRLTNVVLAAAQARVAHPGFDSAGPTLPLDLFLNAARTNWGVAWLDPDPDGVVRHHWPYPSPGPYPSLPWAAAKLMGRHLEGTPTEKWIRYYVSTNVVSLSYDLALAQNPGYFHGKIVFIGNKPKTPRADGEVDKFKVPQTRWTDETVGGVEILTTSFLNLLNGDWLRRMSGPVECLLLILSGVVLGFTLSLFQRGRTFALAGLAVLLAIIAGTGLSTFTNYWFPWLIVAGGQLPCALAWTLFSPKVATTAPASGPAPQPADAARKTIVLSFPEEKLPDATDFELFTPPIGQGGYGKVWIVRNAIGQWQALKAIYQSKFGDNPRPFEAEFRGLQKYKPVSEKHPARCGSS